MRISYSLVIIGFTLAGIGFSINDAYGAGYIKFDGVDGESVDKDHKGWSDLLSFEQAMTQPGGGATGATRRRGDVIMEDIVIVKELDKASPKIAESVATGKVFPTVSVVLCSNQNTECSTIYELSNVMVTSYTISGAADDIPVEEFSLNFEKINRNSHSDSKTEEDTTSDESEKERVSETTEDSEVMVEDDSMKPKPRVPGWVQSTAKFWVDRNVSDREFTDAIGYLVKEKIIDVEVEPQLTEPDEPLDEEPQVPAWIAQSTEWWINGQVPEDQFLEGIKWMIQHKIITGLN